MVAYDFPPVNASNVTITGISTFGHVDVIDPGAREIQFFEHRPIWARGAPIVPTSCSASTEFNDDTRCERVFDGNLRDHWDHNGEYGSWAAATNSAEEDVNITLNFDSPKTFNAMFFAQRYISGCFSYVRLTFDGHDGPNDGVSLMLRESSLRLLS